MATERFDCSAAFPGYERAEASLAEGEPELLVVWLWSGGSYATLRMRIDRIYGDLLEKARRARQDAE